jgi:hypothetical protein
MIPFRQKQSDEKNQNSKYKIDNTNSNNFSKVIAYPKYKKKKEKGIKVIKKNKIFLIILGLVMFFTLLSFIDNNLLKGKYGSNGKPVTFELSASSTFVSEAEFSSCSKIIESKIKDTLHLTSEYTITTKTMHKNGSSVYAQGDISLGKSKTTSFDMILKDNKPYSLFINGIEYIK